MKYDVIVVGGGPAGVISAVTARKYYPNKNILLIKNIEEGVIPCGIPYMLTTMKKPEDNAIGNKPLEKNNIGLKIDEVISINREKKSILTKRNETLEYEKLILATGSNSIMPSIVGIEKKGIYSIKKDMGYLKNLRLDIEKAKDIVIVGGGFIGIEFADEISQFKDKNVTVVEFMPEILANSFDIEFSKLAREIMIKKGINILTGKKVVKFNGEERVGSVSLSDNIEIPCQVVILGIGAVPNTSIAERSGLDIGKSKGILVDEYLRTYSDNNIFAIGDCSEKRDFFTRKRIPIMLASTATAEARIAGANLFELKLIRENKGTIATYSTKVGDLVLGSAGMTEQAARKEGFEIVVGNAEAADKHPECLPNSSKIKLKLVFSKQAGVLLGGQVAGGDSAGEIVNIIGLALQKTTTLAELETLQVATHPKLTAAPTTYPLIIAAQDALDKYNMV
jgi:NADPH-dependent 2,4-dienoyl-CoA reductase/sulfur reductase-like enzyme